MKIIWKLYIFVFNEIILVVGKSVLKVKIQIVPSYANISGNLFRSSSRASNSAFTSILIACIVLRNSKIERLIRRKRKYAIKAKKLAYLAIAALHSCFGGNGKLLLREATLHPSRTAVASSAVV